VRAALAHDAVWPREGHSEAVEHNMSTPLTSTIAQPH
jgi:hypothetical protein